MALCPNAPDGATETLEVPNPEHWTKPGLQYKTAMPDPPARETLRSSTPRKNRQHQAAKLSLEYGKPST